MPSNMKNRRELIKNLTIGAAWTTPVVRSVILPVHAQTTVTMPPVTYTLNCDFKIDLIDVGSIVNNEQTFILNINSSASAIASDGSPVNTLIDWTITYPGNFTLADGTTNMVNGSASIFHSVTFDSFLELLSFPANVTSNDATVTYRFSDPVTYGSDEGVCAPFD